MQRPVTCVTLVLPQARQDLAALSHKRRFQHDNLRFAQTCLGCGDGPIPVSAKRWCNIKQRMGVVWFVCGVSRRVEGVGRRPQARTDEGERRRLPGTALLSTVDSATVQRRGWWEDVVSGNAACDSRLRRRIIIQAGTLASPRLARLTGRQSAHWRHWTVAGHHMDRGTSNACI